MPEDTRRELGCPDAAARQDVRNANTEAGSGRVAWPRRGGIAFAVLVFVAAFFLFAEHHAHVLPFLPWLLLAACPLMHLFMHRGHHHSGAHGHGRQQRGPS